LANVMITLRNSTLHQTASCAQKLSLEEANPKILVPLVTLTSFDVLLMLKEGPNGLMGTCVYKPRLFQAKTIDGLLHDFQEVLERMTTHPERPISEIRVF
jgi:hypothetical protein